MSMRENFKGFYAKKSLDAVSTSSLEENVFGLK